MKILIAVVVALMCVVSTKGQSGPREVRIVNGREVDITAAVEWNEMTATERSGVARPMEHWKVILVQTVRKQIGSWDLCTVTTEKGKSVEILVANLPSGVRDPLFAANQIDARIRTLNAALNQTTPAQAATYSAGPRSRAMMDQTAVNMQNELDSLISKRVGLAGDVNSAKRAKVFSMNTGKTYAGYEVWDCGKVKGSAKVL